ncbi:MAG TPA: hypothetical protein VGD45_01485 [Steroidobacter sp.]
MVCTELSVWSGLQGYLLKGDVARAFNIPSPGVALLVQPAAPSMSRY